MDQTTKTKVAKQLRNDIKTHEAEIARLRDLLAYVDGEDSKGSAEAAATNGSTSTRARRKRRKTRGGPTVKSLLAQVFDKSPGQWLTVADVHDHMTALGWTTTSPEPKTILRTNLRRMRDDGELVVGDDGKYARPPEGRPVY